MLRLAAYRRARGVDTSNEKTRETALLRSRVRTRLQERGFAVGIRSGTRRETLGRRRPAIVQTLLLKLPKGTENQLLSTESELEHRERPVPVSARVGSGRKSPGGNSVGRVRELTAADSTILDAGSSRPFSRRSRASPPVPCRSEAGNAQRR